jgi:hypothetical protein
LVGTDLVSADLVSADLVSADVTTPEGGGAREVRLLQRLDRCGELGGQVVARTADPSATHLCAEERGDGPSRPHLQKETTASHRANRRTAGRASEGTSWMVAEPG